MAINYRKQLIMKTDRIIRLGIIVMMMTLCGVAKAQCPSIDYDLRSHNPLYVSRHWDTVVTCANPRIKLDITPFITTQYFNGTYTVESIPYNPPDTTFHSTAGGGAQLFANSDDIFAPSMSLPFPFSFFGQKHTMATVGANGIITFDSTLSGQFCQFNYAGTMPIPSTSFQHKNAIYGVYEDIDPQHGTSGVQYQGIYEAIYDTFPCRKLCVSWNGIPQYGHSNDAATYNCTYQIVCYEGTNIIDVYVKKRKCCSTTNNGLGIIGIQNAAGTSAFVAPGRSGFTDDINTPEAWRFTPQGTTICNINWYYGTDTSAATGVQVIDSDTTLTYQNEFGSTMSIEVEPTVPTTYTIRMRYIGATGILYDLATTITVGIDKGADFSLSTNRAICCQSQGTQIDLTPSVTQLSAPIHKTWSCNDERARYTINADSTHVNVNPFSWMPFYDFTRDTSKYYCSVEFANGCYGNDSVIIEHIKRADTTFEAHICNGQTYTFLGNEYSTTGSFDVECQTAEHCAYINTLRLSVHNTDFAIDEHKDCHPYTWIDGETYDETTMEPTITLPNRFGCDSTINLNFYYDNSLHAIIDVMPEAATLDHLHLQLKDMSLGASGRKWYFPNGTTDTNVTVYYEFPADQDSITIMLVAYSQFDCEDTAYVTIPLLKESIWFPNAFTPGKDINEKFMIKGIGITSLEVEIYDRRGLLINKFEGIDGFWDGRSLNGQECPMGNYVFVAKYTNILNPRNPISHRGSVMLIR